MAGPHGRDQAETHAESPLEDLVAGALAAHDEGGEPALLRYLSRLGAHAGEVRSVLDRFFAVGVLTRPGPAPAFPERLGEFRLLQQLGAGGMGVVFRAEQSSLRREVALKVVRPELLLFEGARERFKREVDAIALLRHPGIVPILAVGEDRGIPYFAMDLIAGKSGEDVSAAVRARDPASLTGRDLWSLVRDGTQDGDGEQVPAIFAGAWWQACARLCEQIAQAMRHAHVRGILHRDLKPSNVMLTPHGQALVLDFGLARLAANERITRTGTEIGSPAYMSPEQVRGEPLDDRTESTRWARRCTSCSAWCRRSAAAMVMTCAFASSLARRPRRALATAPCRATSPPCVSRHSTPTVVVATRRWPTSRTT